MGLCVYVKVVGFNDVERHALNTLFKLSLGRPTSYALWTPEVNLKPHLLLIDLDAYEAAMELVSPGMNPNLKVISVGHGVAVNAWRTFERPLSWPSVVAAMDDLFVPHEKPDAGFYSADSEETIGVPPGFKVSLLVNPSREDQMYLRARLALAGHTDVDDVETGAQALELTKKRRYDLVIVGLDLTDMDGWSLIRQLMMLEPAIGSVVVTTTDKSWYMREHAEASGCRGLLEKPYDPLQVVQLLQIV
jgi:CheY-like chemotaxis protein